MGRLKRHSEKALNILCTDMEISYRKKQFPNLQSVSSIKHKISCTACGKNLANALKTGQIFNHPSLEVIICQECLEFYGDGLFSTDKAGDDVYCRWCAQGGMIYCCSKCSVSFCKKCIERNLKSDRKVMSDIEKDDWACFVCQSKPLWYLRALCWAVFSYKKELENPNSAVPPRKRKISNASSVESEKTTPRRSVTGPASKKVKAEETSSVIPGKRPGPASRTIQAASTKPSRSVSASKVKEEPKEDRKSTNRQTRNKTLDFTPKIVGLSPVRKPSLRQNTPKSATPKAAALKQSPAPKKAAPKKKPAPKAKKRRSSIVYADSSEEEDVESLESGEDERHLESEDQEPMEQAVKNALQFCTSVADKLLNKLIKYGVYYSNFTTSGKVNGVCMHLHNDLRKTMQCFKAIDTKLMGQLEVFNEAQRKIDEENDRIQMEIEAERERIRKEIEEENERALAEEIDKDINLDEYGVELKELEEPKDDTTIASENTMDVDENKDNEGEANKADENGQEKQDSTSVDKVEGTVNNEGEETPSSEDKENTEVVEKSTEDTDNSNKQNDEKVLSDELKGASDDVTNPVGSEDKENVGEVEQANLDEKMDVSENEDAQTQNKDEANDSNNKDNVESAQDEDDSTHHVGNKEESKHNGEDGSNEDTVEDVNNSNQDEDLTETNDSNKEVEKVNESIDIEDKSVVEANDTSDDINAPLESNTEAKNQPEIENNCEEKPIEDEELQTNNVTDANKTVENEVNKIPEKDNIENIDGLSDISDKSENFETHQNGHHVENVAV